MQLKCSKGIFAALPLLVLSVAAYAFGISSLAEWTILVGFIVLPALVVGWWWGDRETLSEIIQQARR